MTRRIILVTGGQRSGKSGYAQRLALELSDCPVYMATSRVWDEEYRKRIERHQRDRGPQWTNIEEEKALRKHHLQGRVIVIDCVTDMQGWVNQYIAEKADEVVLMVSGIGVKVKG